MRRATHVLPDPTPVPDLPTDPDAVQLEPADVLQVEALVDHINANHADTVLLVARHVDPTAVDAEVAMVEPSGVTFDLRDATGRQVSVRLPFPDRAADADQVQGFLLAAVRAARSAAEPGEPLTSLEAELASTATLTTRHGHVVAVWSLTPYMVEVTLGGFVDLPLHGATSSSS